MVEGELALALFGSVCVLLLFGFPVALTLAGTALLFAAVGVIAGHFDASFVAALSGRMFGTITNETLVAVPLFILMGVTLERAKIAEELLTAMASGLGNRTGGLGISVIVVGASSRQYRYCRRDSCDNGRAGAALHASCGLQPIARHWAYLCHGHIGSNYSAIYCARIARGYHVHRLSAGAVAERYYQYTNRICR